MMLWLAQDASQTGNSAFLIWGSVLLAAALGLLLLELFVPSGGLIGVIAGIAAIGSLVAFFRFDTTLGFAMTGAYIILAPIIIIAMFKLWLHSGIAKRMILGGSEPGATDTSEDTSLAAEQQRLQRLATLKQLIGAEGVSITALRPVGTVRIGDRRLDALAESGAIDADTPIVVTDVYDNQVKVRPAI